MKKLKLRFIQEQEEQEEQEKKLSAK